MKTIIITGANGGLGMSVTSEFLAKGYRVLATVSKESAKSDFSSHPNLQLFVADLSNEKEATDFVEQAVRQFGTLHAGLLLVGGFAMGNIKNTSGNDLHRQLSINFETAYYVARPLFEHLMTNKSGRIVFIGARPALLANAGKEMLAYSLSKSLLFKLSDFLNATAEGLDVSCAVVVPSTLDTPANRKAMPDANPDNWVKTADIAATIEFIVSDRTALWRETVIKMYGNA